LYYSKFRCTQSTTDKFYERNNELSLQANQATTTRHTTDSVINNFHPAVALIMSVVVLENGKDHSFRYSIPVGSSLSFDRSKPLYDHWISSPCAVTLSWHPLAKANTITAMLVTGEFLWWPISSVN